ncbi:MAG: DUF2949 domain-containing protein [Oscillatoriales cyanobacterium RM2_1_1]|nr:DUF2949 domain-containing protein [Oscillatoriales cyanobacterium SM2_3_0]NJO47667.1 DUF2949 domain-containing protein [Oscillatoriales cyanobacterium RM2_1_1]
MTPVTYSKLIRFLQEELLLSPASIAFAQKTQEKVDDTQEYPDSSSLLMILWQYGLVTLEQLEKIFDWLETAY